jgi:hypothetical protein
LAAAVVDLIRSTDGGKAIGIEGGWGSGKTTVVKLVKSEIERDGNYTVVEFDAWAHEGDPLRRTFLETLIDHFTAIQWLHQEEWKDEKEIIRRRLEKRKTTTVPYLTWLGKLAILLVILVPVGTAMMNAALREPISFRLDPGLGPAWYFIGALVLSLAPALPVVAAIAYVGLIKPIYLGLIRTLRRGPRRNGGHAQGGSAGTDLSQEQLWAMFFNKSVSERRIETNETPNPTSIEFEETFCRIMESALRRIEAAKEIEGSTTSVEEPEDSARRVHRRAILVLDNLDRIDASAALSIWSTLQAFLRPREIRNRNTTWLKNLWIIMPYDLAGLRQLWSKRDDNEGIGTLIPVLPDSGGVAPSPNHDQRGQMLPDPVITGGIDTAAGRVYPGTDGVALSFLDKSFHIRFEVPPPVLSNWHSYLSKLLGDAFRNHKISSDAERRAEFHDCYRLYARYLSKKRELPTPRGVILYVNQIGGIHRQRGDEFALSHIAYYVLLRRLGHDVIAEILAGYLPEPDVSGLLGDAAIENLAAMAFNVSVAEAKQIILHEPINRAITIRDPDELKRIASAHGDKGFWEALEATSETWSRAGITMVANVAYCLSKSELLATAERPEARSIRSALRTCIFQKDSDLIWPFNAEIAEGLAELSRLLGEWPAAARLLASIGRGLNYGAGMPSKPIDMQSWLKASSFLLDRIRSLELTIEYSQSVLASAEQGSGGGEMSGEGRLARSVSLALCQPMSERLRITAPAIQSFELDKLLRALCGLRHPLDGGAYGSIERLVSEGYLFHHLANALAEQNTQSLAVCLYAILVAPVELDAIQEVGRSEQGKSEFRDICSTHEAQVQVHDGNTDFTIPIEPLGAGVASLVAEFQDSEFLLTVLSRDNATHLGLFWETCLQYIARGEHPEMIFTSSVVLNYWPQMHPALAGTTNDLIDRLLGKSDLLSEALKGAYDPTKAELYSAIAASPQGVNHKQFGETMAKGMESTDKEEWTAEMLNGGPLVRTLQMLLLSGVTFDLGVNYRRALVDHGKALLDQKSDECPLVPGFSGWEDMLEGLAESLQREQTVARLLELAGKRNGEIPNAFFDAWGPALAREATARGEENVFEDLFTPLLRKRNARGIRWIADSLALREPTVLRDQEGSGLAAFRDELRKALIEGSGDEMGIALKEIARFLQVELPNVPPSTAPAAQRHLGLRLEDSMRGEEREVAPESQPPQASPPEGAAMSAEDAIARFKELHKDASGVGPTCSIIYAWGEQDSWVLKLAEDLRNAGAVVVIDHPSKPHMRTDEDAFLTAVSKSSVFIVVGTPGYKDWLDGKAPRGGSTTNVDKQIKVSLEQRLSQQRSSQPILPIIRQGNVTISLPAELARAKYIDFTDDRSYGANLLELLNNVYSGPAA